ncbi:hypothetical protein B0H66DRAFT_542572 [Apodospora peruviana]|uniref:Uncharacterized protein n=1 Tax=Apodospora peruviana TaxID=516989 RepID=A0AAE0IRS8_9PEZI|nr:hypothetical protein B0H66DRAFT_542572 [Apodospora peruviana]
MTITRSRTATSIVLILSDLRGFNTSLRRLKPPFSPPLLTPSSFFSSAHKSLGSAGTILRFSAFPVLRSSISISEPERSTISATHIHHLDYRELHYNVEPADCLPTSAPQGGNSNRNRFRSRLPAAERKQAIPWTKNALFQPIVLSGLVLHRPKLNFSVDYLGHDRRGYPFPRHNAHGSSSIYLEQDTTWS